MNPVTNVANNTNKRIFRKKIFYYRANQQQQPIKAQHNNIIFFIDLHILYVLDVKRKKINISQKK